MARGRRGYSLDQPGALCLGIVFGGLLEVPV